MTKTQDHELGRAVRGADRHRRFLQIPVGITSITLQFYSQAWPGCCWGQMGGPVLSWSM